MKLEAVPVLPCSKHLDPLLAAASEQKCLTQERGEGVLAPRQGGLRRDEASASLHLRFALFCDLQKYHGPPRSVVFQFKVCHKLSTHQLSLFFFFRTLSRGDPHSRSLLCSLSLAAQGLTERQPATTCRRACTDIGGAGSCSVTDGTAMAKLLRAWESSDIVCCDMADAGHAQSYVILPHRVFTLDSSSCRRTVAGLSPDSNL
eukprot:989161-Rhodomonas_salina.1